MLFRNLLLWSQFEQEIKHLESADLCQAAHFSTNSNLQTKLMLQSILNTFNESNSRFSFCERRPLLSFIHTHIYASPLALIITNDLWKVKGQNPPQDLEHHQNLIGFIKILS